jgi:hypothetical protein
LTASVEISNCLAEFPTQDRAVFEAGCQMDARSFPCVAVRRRVPRRRVYGILFREALTVAWEASGYVCSERLQPFLGELVPLLEQHGDLTIDADTRALLLAASVSTVERTVATVRRSTTTRRMSQTEPGTLLRRQIPALVGHWTCRHGFASEDPRVR